MTRGQNMDFKITAPFEPDGDQPQAIEKLAEGIEKGLRTQVLLGATGHSCPGNEGRMGYFFHEADVRGNS